MQALTVLSYRTNERPPKRVHFKLQYEVATMGLPCPQVHSQSIKEGLNTQLHVLEDFIYGKECSTFSILNEMCQERIG